MSGCCESAPFWLSEGVTAFYPIIGMDTFRVDVRFGKAAMVSWTAQMGAKQKWQAESGMAAIETQFYEADIESIP